jgi:hypothetical protein
MRVEESEGVRRPLPEEQLEELEASNVPLSSPYSNLG